MSLEKQVKKSVIRSHKIRLRPTQDQKKHLHRAFAAARYAWNFGKEILDAEYDISYIQYRDTKTKYKFSNAQYSLKKLYRNKEKPSWVTNVGSVDDSAFEDLQRAVNRFFDIQKGKILSPQGMSLAEANGKRFKKDRKKSGWPKWRSKKKHNSFRQTNVSLKIDGCFVRYNAKVGWIRMCENLRFQGKLMNATFSYDGQWYWASIQVKFEKPDINTEQKFDAVGIDLGIKYLAITSDGVMYENPKAYYTAQAALRRLQRKLDRQRRANNPDCYNADGTNKTNKRPVKKSNQMRRTETKIKRLHTRIKNLRTNSHHNLTADIAKNYNLIVIEDLNVEGMLKNHKLAKSISDAGFYEMRRQLEYKSDYYSGMVSVIDQWFPSSKMCSGCGEKKSDLKLSDREWTCKYCGQHNDRDINAAINLKNEGLRLFANPDLLPAGSPVTA
jgi:putative transposase